MKVLWDLFMAFFRIGALTFGGGYAMLPLLEKEVVEKYHWASKDDLLDYYAVGQCLPGIIAVNTSVFVGNKVKGIWGSLAAVLGVATPSIIVIDLIAAFLKNFSDLAVVQHAFAGIRVAVAALIVSVIFKLFKTGIVDKLTLALFIIVFGLTLFVSTSPIYFVVAAAVLGILAKKGGKKA